MVDAIAPIPAAPGPFDTAQMQIAQAQAQAAAAHTNEAAFLSEIAKTNDETNAHALDSTPTPAPAGGLFSNSLLNLDPSSNPDANPANLAFLTEFGSNLPNATNSDSVKAQQLHDMGILQQDAALLVEAANENNHIPLGSSASTVDLSTQAQGIVSGTTASLNTPVSLTPPQLAQLGAILQPIANQPLTPALLAQIEAQLAAAQITAGFNVNSMVLAMGFMAGMQTSPNRVIKAVAAPEDHEAVAAVTIVDKAAAEDSAIR